MNDVHARAQASPSRWPRTLRAVVGALGFAGWVAVALQSGAEVVTTQARRLDPAASAATRQGPQAWTVSYRQWWGSQQRLAAMAGARLYLARYNRAPKDYQAAAVAVAGGQWAPFEGWWGLPSEPQGGQALPVELPAD